MKVLHLAGVLGRIDWLEWTESAAAPRHDVLCVSSLFDSDQVPSAPPQQLRDWCQRRRLATVLCSGAGHNLDRGNARRSANSWMAELRTDYVVTEGGAFCSEGWLIEAVPAGALPLRVGQVCVTPRPPAGSRCAFTRGLGDQGDPALRTLVRSDGAPSTLMCGSVHQPLARHEVMGWTLVINPGVDLVASTPSWALLDLKSGILSFGARRQSLA